MKTKHSKMVPRIVPPTEWDAARQELLVKEKAATRARDALARGAPPVADGQDRQGLCVPGAGRPGESARSVRRAPSAHHLPLHVRSVGRWLAGGGLPRLFVLCRPDRPPSPSTRSQYLICLGVSRAAGEHPAL